MTTDTLSPVAEAVKEFTLTSGQQAALEAFTAFLLDPLAPVFVLCGYSGTGKTTLVRILLQKLDAILKTIHLINPDAREYSVELTATTNKAAEAFSHLTEREVKTIHSSLGLRVQTDYTTRKTSLVARPGECKHDTILFIDEASYIDHELMGLIFQQTKDCKIIFMGDPAQLSPVKSNTTPVFDAKFPTAMLTQVVRQAEGNPIVTLSTQFRETVSSGNWTKFVPDNNHVQHMPREKFEQEVLREFNRPDWRYHDSKILAWTNERVIDFNHAVRDCVKGGTDFQEGDYAVCNAYVAGTGGGAKGIKTDEMVQITSIGALEEQYGVMGRMYEVNHRADYFGPTNLADWKAAVKRLKAEKKFSLLNVIDATWIDLRAAYACTVNKSQGSTFDRVFIDLDDIGRCTNANLVARMLYVAVSRARHQVFLTGDI